MKHYAKIITATQLLYAPKSATYNGTYNGAYHRTDYRADHCAYYSYNRSPHNTAAEESKSPRNRR